MLLFLKKNNKKQIAICLWIVIAQYLLVGLHIDETKIARDPDLFHTMKGFIHGIQNSIRFINREDLQVFIYSMDVSKYSLVSRSTGTNAVYLLSILQALLV